MDSIVNKTLGYIVSMEPAAAQLFEKYGLDFCCKGKRTIDEACKNENLDARVVKGELEKLINNKKIVHNTEHFEQMELDVLIDHILHKHHTYVKSMLPILQQHIEKVANTHGERHPELIEISYLFHEIKNEFEQHMFKEEQVLFPYIKQLVQAKHQNDHHSFAKTHFVANPILVMEAEHEYAGKLMERIHDLSDNFSAPAHACATFKLSYLELSEFEKDLHMHVHLENNILFPKAWALENVLYKVSAN